MVVTAQKHIAVSVVRYSILISVLQVHGIVSPQLLAPFTQSELELLLSGLPAIDIVDWRQNCEYRGCSADTSECEWCALHVPSRMLTRMAVVQVLGHCGAHDTRAASVGAAVRHWHISSPNRWLRRAARLQRASTVHNHIASFH